MITERTWRDAALEKFSAKFAQEKPSVALGWLQEQADPEARMQMLRGALPNLSGSDLDNALQLLPAPDVSGKNHSMIRESLARYWDLDHPTLARWATRQPNNETWLRTIAVSWSRRDPELAGAWLQTLPEPARDDTLRSIVDAKLARVSSISPSHDMQEAERWIVQLSSEQARLDAYIRLAELWLREDSNSARSWIKVAPLPQATRDRLLK
jgi:hypothetical protein